MATEVGTYKGKTGWDGWVCTIEWISFIRKGEVHTYTRNNDGAVVGTPSILKF